PAAALDAGAAALRQPRDGHLLADLVGALTIHADVPARGGQVRVDEARAGLRLAQAEDVRGDPVARAASLLELRFAERGARLGRFNSRGEACAFPLGFFEGGGEARFFQLSLGLPALLLPLEAPHALGRRRLEALGAPALAAAEVRQEDPAGDGEGVFEAAQSLGGSHLLPVSAL